MKIKVTDVKKSNIWEYEQNKPTLIVVDLKEYGVPEEVSYKILLARGVFKWLGVRRSLIKLKNTWKDRIKATLSKITNKEYDNAYEHAYLKGYLKAYEECRKEVRALCHSERWQAPDFDKKANEFLEKLA